MTGPRELSLAPLLRGVLARPSGNEDDPYTRVVLVPAGAAEAASADVLAMDMPAGGSDDDIRGTMRDTLGAYVKEHGNRPAVVRVGSGAAYRIREADASPSRSPKTKNRRSATSNGS